jgi:hypothetical protein
VGTEADENQEGGDAHLVVRLQEMRDRHPMLVRELAGRWEQGLRGLLGLVGASGLVGAPLAADRLTGTTQAVVGVLLGAVLVAAAGGLALVMSAAYGSARLHPGATTSAGQAMQRRELAEEARNRLRWGRALALASLGLFAAAVTVAWLNTGENTKPHVQLETTTGVTHCGTLLDAPAGSIAVRTDSEGRVEVPAREVKSISVAEICSNVGQ